MCGCIRYLFLFGVYLQEMTVSSPLKAMNNGLALKAVLSETLGELAT